MIVIFQRPATDDLSFEVNVPDGFVMDEDSIDHAESGELIAAVRTPLGAWQRFYPVGTDDWFDRMTTVESPVVMLFEANGADPMASTTLAGTAPTRVIEIDWDEIERGDDPSYARAILADAKEYGVDLGSERLEALREAADR